MSLVTDSANNDFDPYYILYRVDVRTFGLNMKHLQKCFVQQKYFHDQMKVFRQPHNKLSRKD